MIFSNIVSLLFSSLNLTCTRMVVYQLSHIRSHTHTDICAYTCSNYNSDMNKEKSIAYLKLGFKFTI